MEIDEQENPSEVFSNLENRITSLKSKIKSAKGDEEKFELIDRNDIKNKLRELFNSLLGKHLALLKKCLHSKPSQITNGALTQETCVRLLTLGVQQSYEYAKQIAVEFNYFSEKKNWLEKFLLMARSDLREMSIEFLISYLRYTHVKAGGEIELDGGNKSTVGVAAQNEQLALVKRILFKTDADSKSSGSGGVGVGHSSSLIHCLFVHIASDSRSSIDFLMQELYFKFVQNDAFNKSERIRLFNDRTLSHLIKLYSWKEEASEESDEDNTMTVREIINEFLKTLFCSTRYGINFYDKTFSLDMSSERNCNHLIFTTLINLPRFSVKTSNESIEAKTNELIDELILKTLKVCPDLIQRFFKVKQKQESNKKDGDQFWLIRFCIKLFDQQQTIIHSMAKNPAGSSSYLRSLCSQESTSENTNLPDQLMTLIAYTSVPLTLPFPRLIQPVQSPTWRSTPDEKKALLLTLLVSCLKCLKEWRYCLSALRQGELSEAAAPTEIELRKLILDSIKKIYDHGAEEESFHIRFSIELAAKYLPNKEVLVGIANNSGQEDVKSIASDALALFSEVFEKQVTDLDQVEMFNAMNLNHENNNEEKHQTENGIKNGEEEEDEEEEEEEEKMDIDDDLPDSLDKLIEAYSYTMSRRDLRILRAIRSHDPSLNCLLFKLLETNSADTLSKQAKVTDFISLKLNDSLIYESIVNFPLSRKLDSIDEIDGLEFNAKIYDPIYMLPNLYNLLDYSNVVDVVEFPHSKLLSYLFASLSSECDKLRTLAYSSIYRFVSHLENSRAYLKNILLYMVNFLRNSIEKKNQRLSTVISVFLAETVLVVIKPGTVLYRPLTSFLLVKPSLDLYVVPEFYKLFNSSSMDTWIIFNMRQNLIKYKVERKWIMNVIAHSCRTTLDYRVIEKRFVFRQLLGIYVTRMCDNDLKDLIVRLIERVCGIKYALIDLVKRQHFLIWLTGVITEQPITSHVNYQNDLSYFIRLMGIFNRIWAMLGRRDENKSEPLNERKERKTEDEVSDNEDDDDDEEEEEEKSKKSSLPPVTFVNQMHLIARQFISKLEQNQKRFVEIKTQERLLDEKRTSGKMKEKDGEKKIYTVGDVKKETVELFKVNREIIQVLKSYDVILPKTFEDNLDGLEGKIKRCLKRGKINSK